ncbi:ATP-binding protein [Gorillibacterium massiliense]|uniref:ATP-binding protein n=1 Tax=Gorillibacterium massiliense TaxID=1280390 RepID=UPI0004AF935D|nr:ATP-binding protein [Gorillibacterium massiliense]
MQRRNGIMLVMIFTILLGIYTVVVTLASPLIGLHVASDHKGSIVVKSIDNMSWAEKHAIQIGDRIVSVNGQSPESFSRVHKYGKVEGARELTIGRNGIVTDYVISEHSGIESVLYNVVMPSLVFILMVVFSLFIYWKKEIHSSANMLILFFLTMGYAYLGSVESSKVDSLVQLFEMLSFLFCLVFLLHFLHDYFSHLSVKIVPRKLLKGLYALSGAVFLGNFILLFSDLGMVYSAWTKIDLIAFSIDLFTVLIALIYGYIKQRATVNEPVFKIMLFGIFFAFIPYVALDALPFALLNVRLIPERIVIMCLYLVPIVFFYLVTVNRLLDIDFFIRRYRYYLLLSIVPTTSILLLFSYLIKSEWNTAKWVETTLIVYLGMTIFLYFKEEVDYRMRMKVFQQVHNYQNSLQRFASEITQVMKIEELQERIISEFKKILQMRSLSVFEINLEMNAFLSKKGGDDLIVEEVMKDIGEKNRLEIGDIIDVKQGLYLCMGRGQNKYLIAKTGGKANLTKFNREEIDWMRSLANYAGIVYENLHLISGLMQELEKSLEKQSMAPTWLLRLLFGLSEKERRSLATDLHDSVLQDQLYLYRKLEDIITRSDTPAPLVTELDTIKEGILDSIHQIRQTCTELRPPFLKELGINEAVKTLLDYTRLRTNFHIQFDSDEMSAELTGDQMLAIYRIVQELLHNAEKHSKAGTVNIKLATVADEVWLRYEDDGVGMEMDVLRASFEHMGLSGIRERVASLEGAAEFWSALGQGLRVNIQLPLISSIGRYV